MDIDTFKYAYLAGYVDGDGCFYVRKYIQKPKNILVYDYSIQICSVCEEVIQYFSKEFGGAYSKRPEKRSDRKDSYLWVVKSRKSIPIAERLHHFLISKKRICNLFIELGQRVVKNNFQPRTSQENFSRESIITSIKKSIHMIDLVTKEKIDSLKSMNQSIEPSRADFAYFAGLIDAEGCFRIKTWQSKRQGRSKDAVISLEIGNTRFAIFPWIVQRFGGSVVYCEPTNRRHSAIAIWSISSHALSQFLEEILPFLRVKQQRCIKIQEFYKTIMPNGGNRKSEEFQSLRDSIQQKRLQIIEELKILNAKGKHSSTSLGLP